MAVVLLDTELDRRGTMQSCIGQEVADGALKESCVALNPHRARGWQEGRRVALHERRCELDEVDQLATARHGHAPAKTAGEEHVLIRVVELVDLVGGLCESVGSGLGSRRRRAGARCRLYGVHMDEQDW